jgi:hypothetical protein
MKDNPIKLQDNPIESDYEDYICAYLQSGGLYVEKSIIHRETEEILELDIITTDFRDLSASKRLIEVKSGNWGFNEIFKVKGWLVYLGIENGAFIVKRPRDSFEYFRKKAEELNINLIDNSDLSTTPASLDPYLEQEVDEREINTLRYSYLCERRLLKKLKGYKKSNPNIKGYSFLDDYFFKVNSGSFFSNNPIKRIRQLFSTYLKYKNITAKLCHELETGNYRDNVERLSDDGFRNMFFFSNDSPLYIGLYVEHMARLTILKSCIEHLLTKEPGELEGNGLDTIFAYLGIPSTIKIGLRSIVNEPYYHRYPIFWQFFTYVMGGFILKDLRDVEYEYISKNTGIPINEIPRAFDSFNKFFPKSSGWMYEASNSSVIRHRFFPIPFCGIGANHRRYLHLPADVNNDYEDLERIISGDKTMNDLIKWNNLGYRTLL